MNKELIREFKNILIPAEFYTDKIYTELSLSKEESMDILKYINNLEEQNNKQKEVLDKIKEYTNTLLFELNRGKEFEKWEEILNPILELLEEIE